MSKSKLHPELQLDTTLHVSKVGNISFGNALTEEEKNSVISALIKEYDGVQCPALGTVVIDLPIANSETEVRVQLWIHDWE